MNCKVCKNPECAQRGIDFKKQRCDGFIAITNADRVRNMDDYDLAIFLENVSCKHADTEDWLDWLRKECE